MEWKDVAGVVAKSAPLMGTILGGPLGGAIGGVVSLLADAFGIAKAETTPEKINNLLRTDPAAAVKLAEIEANTKIELQKLVIQQAQYGLEMRRAELADTASARTRQVESEKASGKRDVHLYVLAYSYTAGFFVTIIMMTALMLGGYLPVEIPQFVVFLLGNLFATLSLATGAIIQYFYGSSMGSSDKTKTIVEQFKEFAQLGMGKR